MTRHKTLQCVHEPFGDAFYFGPERLAERYEDDAKGREESGYADSTYRTIFDRIVKENSEVSFQTFLETIPAAWLFQSLFPPSTPEPATSDLSGFVHFGEKIPYHGFAR